jgi:hypothetical protein
MSSRKRIARITHERRYVIIKLPLNWEAGDPLPPAGPEDQWFESFLPFIAVWRGPYEQEPIERQPWPANSDNPPPAVILAASARSHDHADSPGHTLDD